MRHIKQFNESAGQGFTEVDRGAWENFLDSDKSIIGTISVADVKRILGEFPPTGECCVYMSRYEDLEGSPCRIKSLPNKQANLERFLNNRYVSRAAVQLSLRHYSNLFIIIKDSDDWWWVRVWTEGIMDRLYKCDQVEGVISLLSHLGLTGS
jgi:hypothetical protein